MKKNAVVLFAFTFFIFISGCNNHARENALQWNDNLEAAVKIAKKENRSILVDFTGSDWCIWCKRLSKEVFSQDDFINYAKNNLVLVKIDFPRSIQQSPATVYYNRQLAERFGVKGFPTIVLLDSKGYIVATTGYREGGAAAYVSHLQSLLKNM